MTSEDTTNFSILEPLLFICCGMDTCHKRIELKNSIICTTCGIGMCYGHGRWCSRTCVLNRNNIYHVKDASKNNKIVFKN